MFLKQSVDGRKAIVIEMGDGNTEKIEKTVYVEIRAV